VIFYSPFGKGF